MTNDEIDEENENVENSIDSDTQRRREFKAFLIIIIFFFPFVTAVAAGSYGFIIWMTQLLLGPPGHG